MQSVLRAVLALSIMAVSLHAQAPAPVALTRATVAGPDSVPRAPRHRASLAGRYALSALGATAGAALGMALAFDLGTRGCSGPEGFCGIGADYGAAWMTALLIPGAAVGAALPRGATPCPLAKRLVTASVGALAGGGIGAMAGSVRSRGAMLWLAAGGSTVGATAGAHRCAGSRLHAGPRSR